MENETSNSISKTLDRTTIQSQSLQRTEKKKENKISGSIEIEADLCKGCGLCVEACPMGVLKMSEYFNKMGYHPVEYVQEGCTGCGICFYVCPEPGTLTIFKPIKT